MHIGIKQPQVRALLRRLLEAGLRAADPVEAVRRCVRRTDHLLSIGRRRYDLRDYGRVFVIGAGKASALMAAALEDRLGSRLLGGLVVVKYGHIAPTKKIAVLEAGHPVPDRAGLSATTRLLALISSLTANDLLFVLLSGGASSLVPAPASGITLAEKQRTTDLLLRSGATIQEINGVRKHLSTLKGGRLLAATKAGVVGLILSDVLGDDLSSVGSGPTAPDPTTYADACNVLHRYNTWQSVPPSVRAHLLRGRRGGHAETPKPGSPLFRRVQNQLIGNNRAAVEAVSKNAGRAGLHPIVLTTSLTGEAGEAAKTFGAIAREIVSSNRPAARPALVIAGGELTVTFKRATGQAQGKGGRAQEFALAAAGEIAGLPRVWIAAFGTDGTDGPTDAAGAVVDGRTVANALQAGLSPVNALDRHDSYRLFKQLGGHIITGPTGTNVNDLYLLLVL
ncbi:MAG: glycerate kinase [Nitrospira sp.]|nr:glycerate kinase [Nitrospira sp.]